MPCKVSTATHYSTHQPPRTILHTNRHTQFYTPTTTHNSTHQPSRTILHTTTHCDKLQHTSALRTPLLDTTTHCNTLLHSAQHSYILQHTATHFYTPHSTLTYYNTLQHICSQSNNRVLTATLDSEIKSSWLAEIESHEPTHLQSEQQQSLNGNSWSRDREFVTSGDRESRTNTSAVGSNNRVLTAILDSEIKSSWLAEIESHEPTHLQSEQ